ncbi:unnamed protein product [Amaranthus hypochondriacus]
MPSDSVLDPTQDPSSIYYLHPSDHAGSKLVSIPFDGTGYSDWKRSMIIGLTAKNKMSFVDGTLAQPSSTSSNHKAWIRCNNMIISWLIASMDRLTAKSIMYCSTAQEIWSDLEERFGQASMAQLYSLQEQLTNMSQQPNQHIADYFTKMKTIWDELDHLSPLPSCKCNGCSCGLTKQFLILQQDQRMMHFLMKVNDNFQQVRTNILMMEEAPSISQAYRLLLQEQRHKELKQLSTPMPDSMAFISDRKSNYQRQYSSSNKMSDRATVSGTKCPSRYFCDHCKISGHSIDRCFKIHGYPPPTKSGKRVSNLVHTTADDILPSVENTGLTTTQFNTLLSLLGKHKQSDVDDCAPTSTNFVTNPNLAGPFEEKASGSW